VGCFERGNVFCGSGIAEWTVSVTREILEFVNRFLLGDMTNGGPGFL
jgi:hypothetical protein